MSLAPTAYTSSFPEAIPDHAALFLDFDGCLVEIAPRPDAVKVPDRLPSVLAALYARLNGAVALISGRAAADLRGFLPEFPGIVAGSHGAELSLPGQEIQPLFDAQVDMARLEQSVREKASAHDGLLVEVKPHGVVLHYRAAPDLADWVTQTMADIAQRFPGMALQPAKMAVELRPASAGKDRAVALLLERPQFAGRHPIYAGDDLTDEVAIAEVQSRGGTGIRVGPGDSVAQFRLPDPEQVLRWLERAV